MTFPPDEPLMNRGIAVERLLYVLDGQVLLHATSPDGRETAYNLCRRGDIIGLTCLASSNVAHCDVTTITSCEALMVERMLFHRLVFENAAATQEAYDRVVEMVWHATSLAEGLASQSLKARLARWILARLEDGGVAPEPGAVLPIDANQRLIAAFAGVSRETVNRQLKTWAEDGIVSVSGRTLRVLRPEQLRIAAQYVKDVHRI
nr:Crp/Fnr family transcriptional regulator [Rhodoplanes tepidamans]